MGQAFKFTFKILKNTKGFISSMVIMPVIMILLVSMTLAYSDVPVVGYIGEKAPSIANVKMMKLENNEKDYFLGISQGTLVVKTDKEGNALQYYTLSYGQQRLLEIARALVIRPRLLILDEPAGGMNDKETKDLIVLIERLQERGISILLIEHDMRLVMRVCARLVVLEHGMLIADGEPKEIRNLPRVIEAYLGPDEVGVCF